MLKINYFEPTGHGYQFCKEKFLLEYHPKTKIFYKDIYPRYFKLDEIISIINKIDTIEPLYKSNYVNKNRSCIISFDEVMTRRDGVRDEYVYRIMLLYCDKFNLDLFIAKIWNQIKPDNNNVEAKFNLISIENNQPRTISKRLKNVIKIDPENSYNLNFPLDDIIEDIRSDTPGLIIFSSSPGGGKTNLIKYLCQVVPDKSFYFLSNSNLHLLTNPSFVDYCLRELEDSVLVLEDCEKVLMSRDINKGNEISNILNITDGILGDLLNLKIVATLNTTDKLDPALLRKGRLIKHVEFKPLSKDQVSNLGKFLNKEIPEPKEMMLCDVYNLKENGATSVKRQSVGFKS